MLASLQGSASIDEYSSFIGLFWIVLVVTLGTRTVDGAVNAGMAFILMPELLDLLGVSSSLQVPVQFALFGFGAVTFAKNPEGVVEANKRKSIQAVSRWVVRHFGEPPSAEPALATGSTSVTVLDALESAGSGDSADPVPAAPASRP
jgi:branched-chain amino acid transport system permease protein